MAWQPQSRPLQEMVGYLKDALSGHDRNAQRYATMVRILTSLVYPFCGVEAHIYIRQRCWGKPSHPPKPRTT